MKRRTSSQSSTLVRTRKRVDEFDPRDIGLADATSKIALPALLESFGLESVPTWRHIPAGARYPVCAKLDYGSGAMGFRIIRNMSEWLALQQDDTGNKLVFQPFLRGPEFRVTLGVDSTLAALLVCRHGRDTWWSAVVLPEELCARLHGLRTALGCSVVGIDVIRTESAWHVIDINTTPDVSMHLDAVLQ